MYYFGTTYSSSDDKGKEYWNFKPRFIVTDMKLEPIDEAPITVYGFPSQESNVVILKYDEAAVVTVNPEKNYRKLDYGSYSIPKGNLVYRIFDEPDVVNSVCASSTVDFGDKSTNFPALLLTDRGKREGCGIFRCKSMGFKASPKLEKYILGNIVELDGNEYACGKSTGEEYLSAEAVKKAIIKTYKSNNTLKKYGLTPDELSDIIETCQNKLPAERIREIIDRLKKEEWSLEYKDITYALDSIIEYIIENKDEKDSSASKLYMDVLEKIPTTDDFAKIKKEYQALEKALNEKLTIKNQVEEEWSDIENKREELKNIKGIHDEHQKENERLTLENKNLSSENDNLSIRNNSLIKSNEQLEKQTAELGKVYKIAKSDFKGVLGDLDISGMIKREAEKSFDREIYERIHKGFDSDIAGRSPWDNVFPETSDVFQDKKTMELSDALENIKSIRRYEESNHEIENAIICIATGFITFFAGKPGTGKTSMCDLIAHSMGLTNNYYDVEGVFTKRYKRVAVERAWTSIRDWVGYKNPITKEFECNDRDVYDALHILSREAEKSDNELAPFIFALDDANLSQMEYYWMQFMNKCDDVVKGRTPIEVELGSEKIRFTKSLRFLATINNDRTTEELSPRLIDRSWIITLPATKPDEEYTEDIKEILPWRKLKELLDVKGLTNDNPAIHLEKEMINKCAEFMEISTRSQKAIDRYLAIALSDTFGMQPEEAVDYAFSQRALTHIRLFGEEEAQKLEKLKEFCSDRKMLKCKKILQDILDNGKGMQYYSFFNR